MPGRSPAPPPRREGRPDRVSHMLFLIVAIVLCLPFVLFVLSNMEPVKLGFWPTDYTVDLPLSLAILGSMALAFLLGALIVWVAELGQRRRARQAERTVRLLEAKIEELQARSTAPALAMSTASSPPTA
jgi:lipopolysaccharide assembly protein A